MLDKKDAIDEEVVRDVNGKYIRKNLIFRCRYDDCDRLIKSVSSPSSLKRHSGYCQSHSKAYVDKPFLSSYNELKSRTAKRNKGRKNKISFDLTYEEFVFLTQIGICCYCGKDNIEWRPFLGDGNFNFNLDRRDNLKGYSLDNVSVCCKECNQMKRDWYNGEEFTAIRFFYDCWKDASDMEKKELMMALLFFRDMLDLKTTGGRSGVFISVLFYGQVLVFVHKEYRHGQRILCNHWVGNNTIYQSYPSRTSTRGQ